VRALDPQCAGYDVACLPHTGRGPPELLTVAECRIHEYGVSNGQTDLRAVTATAQNRIARRRTRYCICVAICPSVFSGLLPHQNMAGPLTMNTTRAAAVGVRRRARIALNDRMLGSRRSARAAAPNPSRRHSDGEAVYRPAYARRGQINILDFPITGNGSTSGSRGADRRPFVTDCRRCSSIDVRAERCQFAMLCDEGHLLNSWTTDKADVILFKF
jgi:hypothetical protein